MKNLNERHRIHPDALRESGADKGVHSQLKEGFSLKLIRKNKINSSIIIVFMVTYRILHLYKRTW